MLISVCWEAVDMELEFYNWQKTLSYNADVTMVIGARGIGKTYGLRLQFIRDIDSVKWSGIKQS